MKFPVLRAFYVTIFNTFLTNVLILYPLKIPGNLCFSINLMIHLNDKFLLYYWRSSHPEVFFKKDVLKNFPKFTGNQLCQSLFFNKGACQWLGTTIDRQRNFFDFGTNFWFYTRRRRLDPVPYLTLQSSRDPDCLVCCKNLFPRRQMFSAAGLFR